MKDNSFLNGGDFPKYNKVIFTLFGLKFIYSFFLYLTLFYFILLIFILFIYLFIFFEWNISLWEDLHPFLIKFRFTNCFVHSFTLVKYEFVCGAKRSLLWLL